MIQPIRSQPRQGLAPVGLSLFLGSSALGQEPGVAIDHLGFVLLTMAAVTVLCLLWLVTLKREVRRQTNLARQKLEAEASLGQRFHDLVEHASEMIFTLDSVARISSINAAGEAMLGFPRSEIIGRDFQSLMAPQPVNGNRAPTRKNVQYDAPARFEAELLRKDGRLVPVEISSWPLKLNDERMSVQGIVRKRIDEQLRQLSRAVEQSPASIVITNPEGEIVYVNPKFCQVTGYSSDEVKGKNPRMLKSGQRSPDDYRQLWQTITSGKEWRGEFRNRKKDGGEFWEFASISPIVDEAGRITHFLAVKEDITELKRAERALRESEERFRALVENTPAGIFVQIEEKFAYLNGHAARLFGTGDPSQLIGRPVANFFHPDYHPPIRDRMRLLNEESKPMPLIEVICLRPDGSNFTAEVSAVPFVYSGSAGALVFLQDVTDRKRLEAQFRHAQKMDAIGQLAGGVAHDFNNILTAILMNLELARTKPGLNAELTECLTELENQADRAAGLTRQLLMFSRRSVMRRQPLDLNELVENLLKMLRRLIGEHIHLQFTANTPVANLKADSGMLEQVVMNLAVNARDAMPSGGVLSISTDRVLIDQEQAGLDPDQTPGHFICLCVTDTGCGMNPADLKRIFEPFFTTKEAGKGTGLGLATVYGIVKQHRGWISVESELGRGSTFRVYLPGMANGTMPAAPCVTPEPIPRGNETILIVEDDQAVRKTTSSFLQSCGYRIVEAASAAEVLKVSPEALDRVDLLLTDMVMPGGLTGLALAKQLQARRPNLPVVISSGYSAELVQKESLPSQQIAYVPKPCPPRDLAVLLRRSLDSACSKPEPG